MRSARAAVAVTLAVVLTPVAGAQADPTYPSQEQIDSARAAARDKAADAARLEQRLAAVMDKLTQLEVAAEVAVENFNEARLLLEQAQVEATEARTRATEASRAAQESRELLGKIAAAAYRSGGVLAGVELVLDAEGPQQVFDELGALEIVADSQATAFARWRTAQAKADEAQRDADEALRAQESAAQRAHQARDAAGSAVASQRRQVAAAGAELNEITAALAAANQTTVVLERQRLEGLRAEAEHKAREEVARKAREAQEAAERKARESSQASRSSVAASSPDRSQPASQPSRSEPSPIQSADSGSGSGSTSVSSYDAAAKKAISFARAQLGEPYVWGAAGPDAWDCSGLTMMAWRQGGVRLTHGARAQFRETQQISYSQLRPGDLVFHSTGGTPGTIYHVGLYIGDGKMIHAPNPQRPVEIKSIFYMGSPDFYSRPRV